MDDTFTLFQVAQLAHLLANFDGGPAFVVADDNQFKPASLLD
jgi:hypothetical protein